MRDCVWEISRSTSSSEKSESDSVPSFFLRFLKTNEGRTDILNLLIFFSKAARDQGATKICR